MAGPTAGPDGGRPAESGPADPVRELIEAHRELCEQAVDPLEIAAGLEDTGLGAGAAGHYRHADVFGLAEEMYARVPRRIPAPGPARPAEPWGRRLGRAGTAALLHLAPVGAVSAVRAALPSAGPAVQLGAAVLAAVGPALAARAGGPRPPGARAGYGVGVALLLGAVVLGAGPAAGAAAAVGAGSAQWCADWVRQAGRGHLGEAVTLAEFRSRMRPVLPVAAALQLALLAVWTFTALAVAAAAAPRGQPVGLLRDAVHRAGPAEWAGQGAVGLVLLLAALLPRCGRPGAAAAVLLPLGAAAAALAARDGGPSGPAALCAAVLAVLLPYAALLLGRPGAHRSRRPG